MTNQGHNGPKKNTMLIRQSQFDLCKEVGYGDCVGGVTGSDLGARSDDLNLAGFELIVEAQNVVARHAENVTQPHLLQPRYEISADSSWLGHIDTPGMWFYTPAESIGK